MFNMSEEEFRQMMEKIMFPKLPYRSIGKDFYNPRNVNAEVCAECGGECCKTCGCHFSPDDFEEISFEYLKHKIEKGYISFDFVDGEMILQDFGVYFLRIRNAGSPIVDTARRRQKMQCILLTDKGCKLSFEERPSGGKLLMPSKITSTMFKENSRCCVSTYSIENCCYEWQPHQKVLHQLMEYFEEKDFPCSF